MHLTADPPDLRLANQDAPAHAGAAIKRAMAKEPGDRFPTAMAFVAALERGEGLAAVTVPSTKAIPAKTSRPSGIAAAAPSRSWGARAAALAVVGVVIAGLVVARQRWLEGRAGADVMTAATPAAPAPASAAPVAAAPSVPVVDSAQAAENARLQAEVTEARRIALDAERKLEQLQAAKAAPAAAAAASAAPAKPDAHAHLFVMVRGGTPAVYVDGERRSAATPSVIEVTPGRHVVTVRGMQPFYPTARTVDLAVGDTTQVLFASKRLVATLDTLDPRTVTPQLRQSLLRAKKQLDGGVRPPRRP
jgi:hypothetical protein